MKIFSQGETESSVLQPTDKNFFQLAISIIGIFAIDSFIIRHFPSIIHMDDENIKLIAGRIKEYLFGINKSFNIIDFNIDNEDIIEFLCGIKLIILHEGIQNIDELKDYIEEDIASFKPGIICNII